MASTFLNALSETPKIHTYPFVDSFFSPKRETAWLDDDTKSEEVSFFFVAAATWLWWCPRFLPRKADDEYVSAPPKREGTLFFMPLLWWSIRLVLFVFFTSLECPTKKRRDHFCLIFFPHYLYIHTRIN